MQKSARDRIVAAARRTFYERGFEDTSFADLAKAAGIPKGNFYYHFKSKAELLDAVLEARTASVEAALREWDEALPTPLARLRRFVAMMTAERDDLVRYGCPMGSLLTELGKINKPILLKQGMSATVDELLQATEYILAGGNQRVVLCERGIRTFETSTRATLDVSAVPVLKERTHLPVIVDPSHAAGRRDLVIPLALAAVAVGADGLIVEAHPNPEDALCDKAQALTADDLERMVSEIHRILAGQGRQM